MKFYSLHNSNRDVRLAINICQLVDDLLFSLGGFINALKRNTKYEEECQERFDAWMCDHDYKEIDRKWLKEKVGDQLKLAWNNRAGKIDSKGKVVEWYKTHQK